MRRATTALNASLRTAVPSFAHSGVSWHVLFKIDYRGGDCLISIRLIKRRVLFSPLISCVFLCFTGSQSGGTWSRLALSWLLDVLPRSLQWSGNNSSTEVHLSLSNNGQMRTVCAGSMQHLLLFIVHFLWCTYQSEDDDATLNASTEQTRKLEVTTEQTFFNVLIFRLSVFVKTKPFTHWWNRCGKRSNQPF